MQQTKSDDQERGLLSYSWAKPVRLLSSTEAIQTELFVVREIYGATCDPIEIVER
jgi:hypothetical protein